MADDTVRLQIDIPPSFFDQACAMFGRRGTEVALAELKQGATLGIPEEVEEEPVADKKPEEEKLKGGKLSILAAAFGRNEDFWKFIEEQYHSTCNSEATAKQAIYMICGIESRVNLDHEESAAVKFHDIRTHFVDWQDEQNQG